MTRRRNHEGTVTLRKDGRWEARVMVLVEGRRRRRSFYGATAKEAQEKLARAITETAEGRSAPPERQSVRTFLEKWLAGKSPDLRPETYRRYGDYCRLHIVPELGSLRLTRLSPEDLSAAYSRLRSKGLSGTTLQHIHGTLHNALADAERWKLILRNPADLIHAPRRSTSEMHVLTEAEAAHLLNAAVGDELEALYVLALTTGLRLGELQALRWRHVDLERRRLSVVATYQGVLYEYEVDVQCAAGTGKGKRCPQKAVKGERRCAKHMRAQGEPVFGAPRPRDRGGRSCSPRWRSMPFEPTGRASWRTVFGWGSTGRTMTSSLQMPSAGH